MVGQFLTGYIKRCGLETEDVPKVAAVFLGAKYCVWGASVALAVRYRPLRRVFLSRRQALLGEAPFSTRKRPWLVEALQRSAQAPGRATPAPARPLKKLPSRVRKAGRFIQSRASRGRKARREAIAAGIANARDRYRAANYSWKLAGWQLLRTQERQKLGVAPRRDFQ